MLDPAAADFGARLRAARERRGVSLRQIANRTKISVGVLEALERNDLSRMPGGIFTRAFVRSYAVEVGLDPEKAIREFIARFPDDAVTAGSPHLVEREDHQALESDRQMATTLLRLIGLSVPIAAAIIYFSVAGQQGGRRKSEVAAASSSSQALSKEPAPGSEPVRLAAAESRAPDAPIRGTGSISPAASFSRTDGAVAVPALKIALTATTACWVSSTEDGKTTFSGVIRPGETRTLEAKSEIILNVGDAGAAILMINGSRARPLGAAGEVKTVRITTDNFKSYYAAPQP
jgi:cytoskeleton protein RodZ